MGAGFPIAQLAHAELLSAKPEETVRFFTDLLGMQVTERRGGSTYLRAYQDPYHHSLVVTESDDAGLGHAAYRVSSPADLEQLAAAIEATGLGRGWSDSEVGQGRTYHYETPDGHRQELVWDLPRYHATSDEASALSCAIQKRPLQGVPVRRIDHLNLLAQDVGRIRDFLPRALGSRVTEQIVLDSGDVAGCWFTVNNKTYDLACTEEHGGGMGRLHHVTYATDQREDILRAADIFLENGVFIETGPHKHAIQQTFFLYVYEPGGNRVEVANAGARLILAPDWKPIVWTEEERKKGQAWGLKTIESFHTHGPPPV